MLFLQRSILLKSRVDPKISGASSKLTYSSIQRITLKMPNRIKILLAVRKRMFSRDLNKRR